MPQVFSQARLLASVSLASFLTISPTLSAFIVSPRAWGATSISQATPTPNPSPSPVPTTPPPNTPQPTNPPPLSTPLPPGDPQTTTVDVQSQFRKYRLGPGDAIAVVIPRFPDLNFAAVVNPEGNIISPLVGVIPVTGLTLEEAQERIRVGLSRYVIDPVVILSLTAQRPVQFTIVGEITKPGFYALGTGSRLPGALLTAGGTTTRADLRAIQVRRSLPDGSVLEQDFDLFTPLVNGTALPDVRIEDGDVVVVPKLEVGKEQGYDRTLVARSTVAKAQITIRVISYPNSAIGNLSLPNGSTFIDALAAANPRLGAANLRDIALVRFDPEQGKAVTRSLNGRQALRGDISQNVALQDNDVIIIGRSLIGKITNVLNVFTQPFRDVLGFLLFFDQLQQSVNNLFVP
jgi:polysaccharide biosynthesis/export protein